MNSDSSNDAFTLKTNTFATRPANSKWIYHTRMMWSDNVPDYVTTTKQIDDIIIKETSQYFTSLEKTENSWKRYRLFDESTNMPVFKMKRKTLGASSPKIKLSEI